MVLKWNLISLLFRSKGLRSEEGVNAYEESLRSEGLRFIRKLFKEDQRLLVLRLRFQV